MKQSSEKTTVPAATDAFIQQLFDAIADRKHGDPEKSYVAALFKKGTSHMARKIGEEAVETLLAAESGTREHLVRESADLLFHLLVLWSAKDVTPQMVIAELQRREGISGIDEKKSRNQT